MLRKSAFFIILTHVTDYDVIAEFVTQLQHDRKEVKALGYVVNKNLDQSFPTEIIVRFFFNERYELVL